MAGLVDSRSRRRHEDAGESVFWFDFRRSPPPNVRSLVGTLLEFSTLRLSCRTRASSRVPYASAHTSYAYSRVDVDLGNLLTPGPVEDHFRIKEAIGHGRFGEVC